MSMENFTVQVGNLTKDIVMETTQGGMPKGKFTLAQNQKWKGKDGVEQEKSHFFACTIWGRYAEVMAPHLTKGTPVTVLGSLEHLRWEKDGQPQSMVVIKVGTVKIGERRTGGQYTPTEDAEPAYTAPKGEQHDEIPF